MFSVVLNKLTKNLGLVSAILLLIVICMLPHITIWDEEWYMKCVQYVQQYGLTTNFIKNDPAAPMHALIYYALTPFTHGNVIGTRIINFAMCLATCYVIYKTIKIITPGSTDVFSYSLLLFAIPSFFVIGFFAITEAPCLLFYSISVLLFLKTVNSGNNILTIMLSGIFIGFAIITRQLFLLCIFPPMFLIFYKEPQKKVGLLLLFLISGLLICAPVFYIWKGIVPMYSGIRHDTANLITIKHGFLSFGYSFFYFMCLIPTYLYQFYKHHKKWLLPLILLGILSSFLIKSHEFLPMSGLLPRLFSLQALTIIARFYFLTTCILAFLLVYFFLIEFIQNRHSFTQIFLIFSMFTILCTPVLISSQFSSRYPLQASSLMLVFCYSRLKPINLKLQTLIFSVTIIINLISVVTFFD